MKITYTQNGDYLIPDIAIRQPKKPPEAELMLSCRS